MSPGSDSDEYGDDGVQWDQVDYDQMDSAQPFSTQYSAPPPPPQPAPPAPPPQLPVKRPLAHPTRNPPAIIRPPNPPAKKQRLAPPPPTNQPHSLPQPQPAAKQPQQNGSAPNLFARKKATPAAAVEEEDLPMIMIKDEGGGYVAAAPQSGPAVGGGGGFDAIQKWGEPSRGAKANGVRPGGSATRNGSGGAAAGGSGLTETEKKELADLRAAKAQLESDLAKSKAQVDEAQSQLHTKAGEIAIVRRRLTTAEQSHKNQAEDEKKLRRTLEERLDAKDRELKAEVARMSVEQAFRRQELETSARRPTSVQSPWSSARPPRGGSSSNLNAVGNSPSNGRSRGGPLQAIQSKKPSFAGFTNAFDSPSSQPPQSQLKRSRGEEGSMPPPPLPIGGSKKGKERVRMLVEEEEGGSGVGVGGAGEDDFGGEGNVSAMNGWRVNGRRRDEEERVVEVDEEEDGGEMEMMAGKVTDLRAEILSTLFNHVTFSTLDFESVLPSSNPSSSSAPSSRLSLLRSSFSLSHRTQPPSTRPIIPKPTPPPTSTSTPTFHFLTNLHLPTEPSSSSYTQLTRDLFLALGRTTSTSSDLICSLLKGLEGISKLVESEGYITALSASFDLISSLITRFDEFSSTILRETLGSVKKGFIPLLATVLIKYCRPLPVAKSGELEKRNGGLLGRIREKTRKVRSLAGGRSLGKGSEVVVGEEGEKVELGEEVRKRLTGAVVGVLEALASKMEDGEEEAFAIFLTSGTAASTLLDVNHPTELLARSAQFFALLACRPNLFRPLLGLKFYDANDVRTGTTNVPILDRIGTLLVRSMGKPSFEQTFKLDMGLLVLVTTLATKHADAILLLSSSPALIPELLDKLFKDTRVLWEHDGQDVGVDSRSKLKSIVKRLSTTVHLFYYLTCAPTSPLNITAFFTQSAFLGLHDRFNVAFGMLAFASLPDWAIDTKEGITLTELAFLAQEIMEDVSPQEAEEIENCFVLTEEEEEVMNSTEVDADAMVLMRELAE